MQGAFIEHKNHLNSLCVEVTEIREAKDLVGIDGLIIPGGESTTMGKLITELGLKEDLISLVKSGLPTWGTCAGLILLANEIKDDPIVHLGLMDIVAVRNSYGRQLGSFVHSGKFSGIEEEFPMIFIRAPHIENIGENVEILAEVDGRIVAAKQDNMLATSFHPELSKDLRLHEYFIEIVLKYIQNINV